MARAACNRWLGAAVAVVAAAAAAGGAAAFAVVALAAAAVVRRGASAASAKLATPFNCISTSKEFCWPGSIMDPASFCSWVFPVFRSWGPAGERRPYFLPIQEMLERKADDLSRPLRSLCADAPSR